MATTVEDRLRGAPDASPRHGSLRRAALASTSAGVAIRLLGALGGVVVARLLGPTDKGTFALLFLAGIIGGALATFGLEVWATTRTARDGWRPITRGIVSVQAGVALVVGGIVAAVLSAFVPPLTALSAGLLVASSSWLLLAHGVLLGVGAVGRYSASTIVSVAVYLCGVLVLAVRGVDSVAWVLAVAVGGRLIALLVAGPTLRGPLQRPTARQYGGALGQGLRTSAGVLVEVAAWRADVLVVAVALGSRDVGLYTTALMLTEALWVVPQAMSQVVLPRSARREDSEESSRVVRTTVLASLPAVVVIVLAAEPAVRRVFGDEFGPAASAVPPLALAAVALGVWKLITADLIARGRPGVRARTGTAGALAMIVVSVGLVDRLGIVAAGLGSLFGYAIALVHASVLWSRTTGQPIRALVWPRQEDLVALAHLVPRRGWRIR